jgi:hypothetical protein
MLELEQNLDAELGWLGGERGAKRGQLSDFERGRTSARRKEQMKGRELEGKLVKKKVGRLARSWERGSERRSRRLRRESEKVVRQAVSHEQERRKEGRISPKAATSFTLLLN